MKKRTIRLGSLLPTTALAIAVGLSGCAPRNSAPQTETTLITESVTETDSGTESRMTETEAVTELATEKPMTLKDIQINIPAVSRSGNADYQIMESEAMEEGAFVFTASENAFQGDNEEGCFLFSDRNSTIALDNGTWHEEENGYMDIWNLVYSDLSTLLEDVEIDGEPCFHISVSSDDETGSLTGLCNAHGFLNVINGTCQYDFYVSKENFDIVRLDTKMGFLGEKEGGSGKGELTASFTTNLTGVAAPVRPEVQVETEADIEDEYEGGTINGNVYRNDLFEIQVAGKDLFSFDEDKTAELDANYIEMNSRYKEEAYGEGSGVIVNISSVPSGGDTKENIMAQYLQDSNAENIQAAPVLTIGGNEYAGSVADINGTMTRTYCTDKNDRVLIITVYYSELSSTDRFESGMFSLDEDPNWSPQEWVLSGKYSITTPNGYCVVEEDSGDIFVCMKDSEHEVNVFAIDGTTTENEIQNEVASTDKVSRNVLKQDNIALEDGSAMSYLEIYNVEEEGSYYTYIGLLQKDTAVIKFYVVNTAEADFTGIFSDFANRVVLKGNTETPGTETLPPEQS